MLTLAQFLQSATQLGCTTVRVLSPRGYELLRGAPVSSWKTPEDAAGELEERCKHDAEPLPARARHEYTVFVEGPDGRSECHKLRVAGGDVPKDEDEHRVEPTQVNSMSAVVGHLVRALIDTNKQYREAVRDMASAGVEAMRENRRLRSASAKEGETLVQRDIIAWQRENEREGRERSHALVARVVDRVESVAARMLPGLADGKLTELRASFSEKQLEDMAQLFGATTLAKLMAAPTAERFVLITESIAPEKFAAIDSVFTPKQKELAQAALAAAFMARQKELAEKQKTTNGAPVDVAAQTAALGSGAQEGPS